MNEDDVALGIVYGANWESPYEAEELSRVDLQSPVVLRSEYEDLLSLARDMYQSLDVHCGESVIKAYKSRMEKHDS